MFIGLDKYELFDTRELTKKIDSWYSGNGQGNPEWANLPRKFNIAISGSRGMPNLRALSNRMDIRSCIP